MFTRPRTSLLSNKNLLVAVSICCFLMLVNFNLHPGKQPCPSTFLEIQASGLASRGAIAESTSGHLPDPEMRINTAILALEQHLDEKLSRGNISAAADVISRVRLTFQRVDSDISAKLNRFRQHKSEPLLDASASSKMLTQSESTADLLRNGASTATLQAPQSTPPPRPASASSAKSEPMTDLLRNNASAAALQAPQSTPPPRPASASSAKSEPMADLLRNNASAATLQASNPSPPTPLPNAAPRLSPSRTAPRPPPPPVLPIAVPGPTPPPEQGQTKGGKTKVPGARIEFASPNHSHRRPDDVIAFATKLDQGLRAYSHFVSPAKRASPHEITIAVHVGMDSLSQLLHVSRTWRGPISASIWLGGSPRSEMKQVLDFVAAHNGELASTALHVLWTTDAYRGVPNSSGPPLHVALTAAHSQFVVVVGAPAAPSNSMWDQLSALLASSWRHRLDLTSVAIMVPVLSGPVADEQSILARKDHAAKVLRPVRAEPMQVMHAKGFFTTEAADVQGQMQRWLSEERLYQTLPAGLGVALLVSKRGGMLPDVRWGAAWPQALQSWQEELLAAGYVLYMHPESFMVREEAQGRGPDRALLVEAAGDRQRRQMEESKARYDRWMPFSRPWDSSIASATHFLVQRYANRTNDGRFVRTPGRKSGWCPCKRCSDESTAQCGGHVFAARATVEAGAVALEPKLHAFTNFARAELQPSRDEVTLVTQIDMGRMERLETLASTWGGPVSCAVALEDQDERSLAALEEAIRQRQAALQQTSFHVLYGARPLRGSDSAYPINHARNVAMDAAESDFVLVLDADMVLNPTARAELQRWLDDPQAGERIRHQHAAWVVPCFEQVQPNQTAETAAANYSASAAALPKTKVQLLDANRRGEYMVVHSDYHPLGQMATNHSLWFSDALWDEPYAIGHNVGYEPYVVVDKHLHGLLPRFYGALKGFGYNKVSWIRELYLAEYRFEVLPQSFLMHIWHAKGGAGRKAGWKTKRQVEVLRSELERRYEIPHESSRISKNDS